MYNLIICYYTLVNKRLILNPCRSKSCIMCKYWALAHLRGLEHFNICEGLKQFRLNLVCPTSESVHDASWTSACLEEYTVFSRIKNKHFETWGSIDEVIAVFVQYFEFSSVCLWLCVLVRSALVFYVSSVKLSIALSLMVWVQYSIPFILITHFKDVRHSSSYHTAV